MRVAVFFRPGAGNGVSVATIERALEAHGHSVVHVSSDERQLERSWASGPELIVAAGGDGTLRQAATQATGRGVPVALLPAGTANNVAGRLGVPRSLDEAIGRWRGARLVPLDLGVVDCEPGPRVGEIPFIEGVGAGLIPCAIDAVDSERTALRADTPAARVASAQRRYLRVLEALAARRFAVTIDEGPAIEQDLLLVEVLNLGWIGANLVLAPDANPCDGMFEVVRAGEGHRELLWAYLRGLVTGRQARLRLPVTRARQVEIHHAGDVHVDGELYPASTSLRIGLRPAAFELLL